MQSTTRNLTSEEMRQVNGGILPVVAAAGSFVGHSAVRSVGYYLFTRAMTVNAVYGAAVWAGELKNEE